MIDFSRERAAGYQMDIIGSAHVVVVGCGALGQNVIQCLALSGIGRLTVIDHDEFESHNLTRSPLFALDDGRGSSKASIVAARAQQIMTSAGGTCIGIADRVEDVTTAVLDDADVIVSAVDTFVTRHWLARAAKLLSKPLIEGGLGGAHLAVAVFGPEPHQPCYSCTTTAELPGLSCAGLARRYEGTRIAPAIQSTAAVAGGVACEHVIEVLHQRSLLVGARFHVTTRTSTSYRRDYAVRELCPNHAIVVRRSPVRIDQAFRHLRINTDQTIRALTAVVWSAPCARCGLRANPRLTVPHWAATGLCDGCDPRGAPLDDGNRDVIVFDVSDRARAGRVLDASPAVQALFGLVDGGVVIVEHSPTDDIVEVIPIRRHSDARQ